MTIVKDICYISNIYIVYIDWSDIQLQLRFAPSPGRFQVCFLLRYVNNVTVTFEIINWHFLAFVFLGDGIFVRAEIKISDKCFSTILRSHH